MIAATITDPASLCADEHRAGLRHISHTLDQLEYVLLQTCRTSMWRCAAGCSTFEVRLLAVGAGPALDFESAAEFLAG
jgi:hypothetical protein